MNIQNIDNHFLQIIYNTGQKDRFDSLSRALTTSRREVTPKKTVGGPKVKNVDLLGQGGKCGPFCGQLSTKGANPSAEYTKAF